MTLPPQLKRTLHSFFLQIHNRGLERAFSDYPECRPGRRPRLEITFHPDVLNAFWNVY